MKKAVALLGILAITAMVVTSTPRQADARPTYLKVFVEKYGEKLGEEKAEKLSDSSNKERCLVCHGKKSKKEVSDYAKALAKALGKKNEKDAEKIEGALGKVEEEKCGPETCFGDLLKKGKLPPPFKAKAE